MEKSPLQPPPAGGVGGGHYQEKAHGALAQLGERLPCTQEVVGSNPMGSTTRSAAPLSDFMFKRQYGDP